MMKRLVVIEMKQILSTTPLMKLSVSWTSVCLRVYLWCQNAHSCGREQSRLHGFISSSFLLPFSHSCQKLPQGYEIKCLLLVLVKLFLCLAPSAGWDVLMLCLVVIFGQCHLFIVLDQRWCLLAPAEYIRGTSEKELVGIKEPGLTWHPPQQQQPLLCAILG